MDGGGHLDWDRAFHAAKRLRESVSAVVEGQDAAVRTVVATALSGGHVLLEDQPGVGKTTLARALAATLGGDMGRIQGTADLLPTDITGVHVYQPNSGEWAFRPGPVLAPVVLIDELNRATPKAQSALLEAMAEGQVTVDGETFGLPDHFLVLATQNPPGEPGTYPLVPAQLDRFSTSVSLGLPHPEVERRLLDRPTDPTWPEAIDTDDLDAAYSVVPAVRCQPDVGDYVMALVHQAREHRDVWLSVRVPQTVLGLGRALAVLDSRDYVVPDDIQDAFRAALPHRLPAGRDTDGIVEQVLSHMPVPLGD